MAYPIFNQRLCDASITKQAELGTTINLNGVQYRYVQAKNTVTVNQYLGSALYEVSKANDVASSASKTVTFTTANLTAGVHGGDLLCVITGTGAGQKARIAGNTTSVLTLETALATALDATSDIYIISEYKVSPIASGYPIPRGVAPIAVTDEYYFWMQESGIGLAIVDDSDTAITPGQQAIRGTDAGTIQGSGAATISAVTLGVGLADPANGGNLAEPILIMPGGLYWGGGATNAIGQTA